ncbi:hypothetical protein RhiirC2_785846 [Rhizophagus irregularis]|uniref:Uncharacterized protein n=1 Tax=Rhizophagus irregularis TaxID=588596 RepID=A0A2N1MVK1_9GLOM|nr:hypothetical protein RhiirC2_785846 [Rhizophagus irregularis]
MTIRAKPFNFVRYFCKNSGFLIKHFIVLSVAHYDEYRDWIGVFNKKLKNKLGSNTFNKIEVLLVIPYIKDLEKILKKVKMLFEEFKILYGISDENLQKTPRND